MSGKYSLELLEPRVMLSADGMAGGLITHDSSYDPADLGAIEVVQEEFPLDRPSVPTGREAADQLRDIFEGMGTEALGMDGPSPQDPATNPRPASDEKLRRDPRAKGGGHYFSRGQPNS